MRNSYCISVGLYYDRKRNPFALLDVTQSSEYLFQFFRDRIHDFAKHESEFPPPIPGADPWLLASLLQKAIRRGDVATARRAARHLLKLDPPRLWRRLMTVALEDIGIGDDAIAAELVAIATSSMARRLLGNNEQAVDCAVRRACAATKDRTGDHFSSMEHQIAGPEHDELRAASKDACFAILSSPRVEWQRRLRAAVLLWDPTCETVQQRKQTFAPAAQAFEQLGAPAHLTAACETYATRARDRLPIFVLLAWCLWREDGAPRAITSHVLPISEMIGPFPGYAFDPIRTRLGRWAIDQWLRSYQFPPFDARQIAIALWNAESAACTRTLAWSLGAVIEQQARSADLLARGLPAERHDEIAAWIVKEQTALACARRGVWERALRNP